MGDNRTGSFDSRAWEMPYVPVEKIKSKALFDLSFWPDNTRTGLFWVG
jgi:signal peptidase I